MAGIITDVNSDIEKLRDLKAAIEDVKKSIESIDISVDINIAKDLEPKLKSLTTQYDELASKIMKTEATITNSMKNIIVASGKIVQAQEKLSKAAEIPMPTRNTSSQAANMAETATIQVQAKAYEDLKTEINNIIGTREANVKRMLDEMNAIRLINAEIKKITKSQGEYLTLSSAQQVRLGQLNNSLLTHKAVLSEVRQTLNNNVKLDNAAATSMNGLSQSLSRMRIAYRELTEEERNSSIGKELLASINQADAKIKELDTTIGNHQRNVGNYSKQWDGLGMSIQQVGRELPSLAYGPKVFFSAISNNLPILVDEIKRAKDAYKSLVSQGEKATPVWKQIASSLFSWQTALTVGITLLTVYGDKLVDWVVELLQGKKALSETYQVSEDFNKSVSEISSNPIATLEKLSAGWKKLGGDIKAQEKYILENKSAFDSTGAAINSVKDAENLLINNKAAFIESIIAKAKATATMKLAAEEYERYLQKMREAETMPEEKTYYVQNGMFGGMTSYTGKNQQKIAAQKEAKKFRTSFDSLIEDVIKYEEEATNKVNEAGVNLTNSLIDGSVAAIKASISKKQKELEQAIDSIEYKRIEAEIKAEQAKLDAITGATADKEANKRLKLQSELSRSLLETELKLQSERLAIMQDGKDKRVLLADQEYKETLAAIQKERDEYQRKINEAKGTPDPGVLSTFTSRENTAKDKRDTAVAGINKEYIQEFADRQKEISSVFLSEEAKRLDAVKDRYEKERKWAEEQHKTGGLNDEQYESYLGTIDKAEGEETLKALLDKYQDYDAKRRELERNYTEEVSTLSAQRTEENKAEVDAAIREAQKRHKEKLANLDFSEFQESGLWKKMFGDLDKMAIPTLQNILDKAKEVNTKGFTPEQVKEYQAAIDRLEEAIRTRSPFKSLQNDWKNLMKAIREGNKDGIANALAGIDQSVQKINTDLDTLSGGIGDIFGDEAGYAAEQVAELTSAIGGFATGASKIASGDILGGITSVVSSIGSIFSMGKKVKEMNRQAREEQQKFYDEARAGELEYHALLRERLRLAQQLGETSLQYFDRLQKELHKQSGSITEEYDEVWAKLMGEQYIEKVNYRHGTWFRKAKTWNDYGSLSGKTYEEIESLYTQNKLTDSAKILFEQLRKLKEEGADVVDMMDELNQSMSEAWTGTTEDAIAQSILEGIAAGKTGVDDLTGYFRDMMKKAMLQGVNMRYLQEPIKKFYEQFADMSESGGMLTEGEIAQLQEMYIRMFENAEAQFENLQKISGLDFSLGEEETSENSLKGAYAKASQESIDLLAGQTGAQRVAIESIREQMQFIRDLQTQGWRDVATIKDLVGKLKEVSDRINITTDEIKKSTADISDHSKRTVEALESTLNVKVKM